MIGRKKVRQKTANKSSKDLVKCSTLASLSVGWIVANKLLFAQ